jgi:hypothetical protein
MFASACARSGCAAAAPGVTGVLQVLLRWPLLTGPLQRWRPVETDATAQTIPPRHGLHADSPAKRFRVLFSRWNPGLTSFRRAARLVTALFMLDQLWPGVTDNTIDQFAALS